MYRFCNKLFANRILRIIISVLLVAVFFIVPIEHKMLEARAAFTAAIAISVICAVLVAMGFTFGRVFMSEEIDAQFSKHSMAKTVESLRQLAQDIYENCPGIVGALAACFPNGNAFETARQIVQIAPSLYQMIKKYIMSKYGDSTEEIESSINGEYGFTGNPIKCGSVYAFSSVDDYIPYSSICLGSDTYDWFFSSADSSKGLYYYRPHYIQNGSDSTLSVCSTKSPAHLAVFFRYTSIYAPDSNYQYGRVVGTVYYPYMAYDIYSGTERMSTGLSLSAHYVFTSYEEYEAAVRAAAGETNPDEMLNTVDINKDLFNGSIANYPQYVYIYENVDDYVGKSAVDIASPAYDEMYDSNVVDSVSRTVTWQGDRTLCPIDELEGSLPAAVIGHWVATWDETSTLCNISCYAEDGTVAWSGEVATTLTWADVIAKLGDIAITGPIAGTIAGAAVGSLAVPDTALDFDPLKIAGETFSKKFPFCLPFDLYRAFKQFDYDAVGQAPVYKIPLNFGDTFGTHYIVIDMAKWTPVANIVKWSVYISFMVSLIIVTKKVMGGS